MLREFKDRVPSCIVRAAAIFSSWCQYEPLDEFITTWCSHRWNARIIGGVGDWAIPYLHVQDLASFFVRLVERCDDLESAETLLACPDGATTQLDLFNEVTREFFGFTRRKVHIPKPIAVIGITMREVLGRITGKMPFERAWMARYIDRKLMIDASRTRRLIDWAPHQDLSVLDTIPSMINNFKSHISENPNPPCKVRCFLIILNLKLPQSLLEEGTFYSVTNSSRSLPILSGNLSNGHSSSKTSGKLFMPIF